MNSILNNNIRKKPYSGQAFRKNIEEFPGLNRESREDVFKKSNSELYSAESHNNLLAKILSDEFSQLLPHLEKVSLSAGQELYAPGEKCDFVYFPETCVISHLYNLADGNTIEIAMVGREGLSGIFSIFDSEPNIHQALVITGGTARRIKSGILQREFLQGGSLQRILLNYFNSYLSQVSQRTVCESFHPIEKRMCSWLLMLNDRVRKKQIALTQEKISLLLGVYRPSISVIAKKLRDEGLINYVRGSFFILNSQGLKELACECYSPLKAF